MTNLKGLHSFELTEGLTIEDGKMDLVIKALMLN